MCGQLGFSGKNNFDPEKIKLLILWNSLERGEDATGIFTPLNGLKKSLLKGSNYILTDNFKMQPDNMLMGHVRAKTIGDSTIENAHPFKNGNWYLQHNGTLKNHYDLTKKYNIEYSHKDVDSNILCKCIEKHNSLDVLKDINGPAAIIAHDDLIPNTLYVFRNTDRPLYRGMINNDMYMSSIEESLKYIGCDKIKEFKPDVLYTIKDGSILKTYKVKNTPYKYEFISSSVNTNNSTLDNDKKWLNKYINSWLPSRYDVNYLNDPYKLIKNNFYLIKELTKDGLFRVYDKQTKLINNFYYTCFDLTYILETNDLCKALVNITHHSDSENIIIKNKEVVRVDFVSPSDNTVKIVNALDGKFICYADREYFRKLTLDEISEFHSLHWNTDTSNNAVETNNPVIVLPENNNVDTSYDYTVDDDFITSFEDFACHTVVSLEDCDEILQEISSNVDILKSYLGYVDKPLIDDIESDIKKIKFAFENLIDCYEGLEYKNLKTKQNNNKNKILNV